MIAGLLLGCYVPEAFFCKPVRRQHFCGVSCSCMAWHGSGFGVPGSNGEMCRSPGSWPFAVRLFRWHGVQRLDPRAYASRSALLRRLHLNLALARVSTFVLGTFWRLDEVHPFEDLKGCTK